MTTRQTIFKERDPKSTAEVLPSGFDGTNAPSDYVIPPCGIEDIERALKNLFDKDLGFATKQFNGSNGPVSIKKPTVILATGERFAIVKKLRPVRDRNNALMLPAIAIRRTSLMQTPEDITGRGINQMTGELIIKRRLDPSDRDYQLFLNKLYLHNTANPSTRRTTGENKDDLSVQQGALLDPKIGNNVFEVIAIPTPQFFTAAYEVTFWSSYAQHMNYMIEVLFSSFLPQNKMFKLVSDKGYWFLAYVEDNLSSQDNFDDFTEKERLVRYSFNLNVKGYLLATNGPGTAVPVRKYYSAPTLTFEIAEPDSVFPEAVVNMVDKQAAETSYILNDITQDTTMTQMPTANERLVIEKEVYNPHTKTTSRRYVKILDRNMRSGETVYTVSDARTLMEFLTAPNGK